VVVLKQTVPSLIFGDEQVELTGTGHELLQALAANATSSPLSVAQVRLTYISEATGTPETGTTTVILPGGSLIAALSLPAPEILLRNVTPESTVGVVRAGSQTRAFFIMHVSSFVRTFAGMLAWEPTLTQDLELLFPPFSIPVPAEVQAVIIPVATTTATSTPAIATTTTRGGKAKAPAVVVVPVVPPPPPPPFVPTFKDEVISNHNVRIMRDEQGRTILLYGYRDKQTLIIARDESAFMELLKRLAASAAAQ
jgi:hypothetical protein